MQDDLFQTATSSQPDTPASHLVRPGSDEARKMTVTSGRKYLPLCKQSDRLGAFSRMFLDTSVWASTKCFLTWKAKATPSNRLLFQLAPSMPRTDETGSGLWPTAVADDTGMRKNKYAQGGTPLSLAVQQPQMWPTPDASDRGPRSADLVVNQSTVRRRDSGQKRGMDLQTAAGGSLNPQWVEWLMGYPEGWTDLKG